MTTASPCRSSRMPASLAPPTIRSLGHLSRDRAARSAPTASCSATAATSARRRRAADRSGCSAHERRAHRDCPAGEAQARPCRPRPPVWRSARSQVAFGRAVARERGEQVRVGRAGLGDRSRMARSEQRPAPRGVVATSPSEPDQRDSRAARRTARASSDQAAADRLARRRRKAGAGSSKYIILTILSNRRRRSPRSRCRPPRARSARPATAAWNTTNFGQKPNSGGMPARLNMNIAMRQRQHRAGCATGRRGWRSSRPARRRHRASGARTRKLPSVIAT